MKNAVFLLLLGILLVGCGSDSTDSDSTTTTSTTSSTSTSTSTSTTTDVTIDNGPIEGMWKDHYKVCGDIIWEDQDHNFSSNGTYTTTITEYYTFPVRCIDKEVEHKLVGTYTLGNNLITGFGHPATEIDINITTLYGTFFNVNTANFYNQNGWCTSDGNWTVGVPKDVTTCTQYHNDFLISGFTPTVYRDIYSVQNDYLYFGAYPGVISPRPTEIITLFAYPKIP